MRYLSLLALQNILWLNHACPLMVVTTSYFLLQTMTFPLFVACNEKLPCLAQIFLSITILLILSNLIMKDSTSKINCQRYVHMNVFNVPFVLFNIRIQLAVCTVQTIFDQLKLLLISRKLCRVSHICWPMQQKNYNIRYPWSGVLSQSSSKIVQLV